MIVIHHITGIKLKSMLDIDKFGSLNVEIIMYWSGVLQGIETVLGYFYRHVIALHLVLTPNAKHRPQFNSNFE